MCVASGVLRLSFSVRRLPELCPVSFGTFVPLFVSSGLLVPSLVSSGLFVPSCVGPVQSVFVTSGPSSSVITRSTIESCYIGSHSGSSIHVFRYVYRSRWCSLRPARFRRRLPSPAACALSALLVCVFVVLVLVCWFVGLVGSLVFRW